MATYKEILAMCKELYAKQHPEARHGAGVAPCHIAHAKELLGMPKRPRTSPYPRKKPCPPAGLHRSGHAAVGKRPVSSARSLSSLSTTAEASLRLMRGPRCPSRRIHQRVA